MSLHASQARSERPVVGWTTGLLLASVLPQYLVGSLALEIRADFSFSDAQLGVAVGISFALAAIISPTAGRTVAWIGVRRGVMLAAAMIAMGCLALATVAGSAAAVIALMGIIGLGAGIGTPSLSTLIAEGVGAGRQGRAFGLFTSAPQVAAVAAGLALPLIAEPMDWRVTFLAPAGIAIVSMLALIAYADPPGPQRLDAPRLDRSKLPGSVAVIAGAGALASAAGIGMRSFLVVFAVSAGFGSSAAGLLLSLTGVFAIASRVGFGVVSDRRADRAVYIAALLMALCAVGFVLMALGGAVLLVAGAVLAGGIGWGWQAPISHAVISLNPTATSAAVGLQMAGFYGGAVAGPLVVGLFAHAGNYTEAWLLCTCLAAAATAMALAGHRLAHGPRPGASPLSKVRQT
jgi:MFS family permease